MGLLRELFDELIPLPDQAEYHFPEPNLKVSKINFGYSILNLFRRIGQKKMVVMEIWIPTTVLADFLVFGRE